MVKSRKILSIAAVSLLLLAACGGGDDGANGGGDGAAATSTVTMRDNAFVPSDPVVSAGEVELVNEGARPTPSRWRGRT